MRGDYARGFELLDEAMVSVTSGQLSPIVTGLVYCSVIETCQRYHSVNRAREWTSALVDWCAEQPDIVAFTGRCLIHRAEILILDGHWDEAGREARLKQAIETVRGDYDFIIVDCPPSLSLLTLNALNASDSVLVPMQCEYYALEGLSALLDTIEALKGRLNPHLEIEGVLRTMFDVRNNLANAVSAELTNHFGELVFRTIVPRNVRLAEAPSHGQSIVGYDRASRGGIAYLGLAGEIVRREKKLSKESA